MTKRKEPRVFKLGHRNVVLNSRSSPDSEFGFYGSAFRDAGQALANDLFSRSGYTDLEALPILYLYRHSIELYLKAILVLGNQLLAMNGEEIAEEEVARVLGKHRVTPFLPHVRTILKAVGAEWHWDDAPELKTFEDLRAVLQELESIDADSFAFRYPVTKKGKGSVPHHFTFDLLKTVKILDRLCEMFDAALSMLDATYDTACDALSDSYGND